MSRYQPREGDLILPPESPQDRDARMERNRDPDAPTGLQLDLLCMIARLEQIRDEGGWEENAFLADRVLTCDLPRVRAYLTAETLAWAATGE